MNEQFQRMRRAKKMMMSQKSFLRKQHVGCNLNAHTQFLVQKKHSGKGSPGRDNSKFLRPE